MARSGEEAHMQPGERWINCRNSCCLILSFSAEPVYNMGILFVSWYRLAGGLTNSELSARDGICFNWTVARLAPLQRRSKGATQWMEKHEQEQQFKG